MRNTLHPCRNNHVHRSNLQARSPRRNPTNYGKNTREARRFDRLHYVAAQDDSGREAFRPKGLFVRYSEDMMWSPKQYKLFIGDSPDPVDHGQILK